MFGDLFQFVAANSYGPTAASVRDIGKIRYCIIYPYNYHLVFQHETIYMILPEVLVSKRSISCFDKKYAALKINKSGMQSVCIAIGFAHVRNVVRHIETVKFVLFNKNDSENNTIESHTIEELLNRCIEIGIFSL